jgi:hypothetical protein
MEEQFQPNMRLKPPRKQRDITPRCCYTCCHLLRSEITGPSESSGMPTRFHVCERPQGPRFEEDSNEEMFYVCAGWG